MKRFTSATLLLMLIAGCSDTPDDAGKTAADAAPATSSQITEAGAPLFDGMGDFSKTITTSSPLAQQYFDQGMVLAFAFNHAESIRSFKAAQKLDPQCAMCFWGEALATGPNINVTSNGQAIMSDDERVRAFAALQQAQALKAGVSEKEQAYIDALSARYNGDITTDRMPLDLAYSEAMGKVAAAYPDDLDAASLHAEALMNTMPWDYWQDGGTPKPATVTVIEQLESVMAKKEDHPLALHLYIHAIEASSDPARAEKAADILATLVPGAGHLVHMPAHIYWRVGRYHDASEANIEAARVDEEYIAQCNAQGFYPALYYPHNIHFLWAASSMQGRSALSIESALRVKRNVPIEMIKQFPTVEFFHTIPLLSYVRFGDWDAIMAETLPDADMEFSRGIYHYARGVAFAARGDNDSAATELESLRGYQNTASAVFMEKHGYPATQLMAIAVALLEGEMALYSEDYAGAVNHYETAVGLQDILPYTEPPFWYYPTRQSLGHALLKMGKAEEAEAVYRRDLTDYPRNGWSLYGLKLALETQNKTAEAAAVKARFDTVWQMADITLTSSRL